jgi:glycosyltransferase involved in cell wall biosynthesis
MKYSDKVIINSKEMWEKSGKLPNTYPISNGVDSEIFRVRKPIEVRTPKVLWCGSTGHKRTKNYDSILIPLKNKLKKYKIPCDFKLIGSTDNNRLNQEDMGYWYNTGSIYVNASSSEGTPNTALEAASCGCTIVSTRTGNMPELIVDGVNGYLCDTTIDSLFNGIKKAADNLYEVSNNMQKSIYEWHWKHRSIQYYDYFRKVINESKKSK